MTNWQVKLKSDNTDMAVAKPSIFVIGAENLELNHVIYNFSQRLEMFGKTAYYLIGTLVHDTVIVTSKFDFEVDWRDDCRKAVVKHQEIYISDPPVWLEDVTKMTKKVATFKDTVGIGYR